MFSTPRRRWLVTHVSDILFSVCVHNCVICECVVVVARSLFDQLPRSTDCRNNIENKIIIKTFSGRYLKKA